MAPACAPGVAAMDPDLDRLAARRAFPPPRRPLPGESAADYELAVLEYLRQAVPRVPQFARCTALMGRELPDTESAPVHFAKVAFWADAVVELVAVEERPAALDRAFVLHLAFDVFGRAWKACKWAQLQTTTEEDSLDLCTVNAHSVSGPAPHRARTHAAGAPYDRSRRSHNHNTGSKQDVDIMHSMTLDAAAVLKGALEASAAMGDVDVDALCATFAAASLNPSPSPVAPPSFPNPAPRSDAAPAPDSSPDSSEPKRKRRKTHPRPPAVHDPWEANRALLRLVESRKRFFGSDARWGPPRRSRVGLDPFTDCIL